MYEDIGIDCWVIGSKHQITALIMAAQMEGIWDNIQHYTLREKLQGYSRLSFRRDGVIKARYIAEIDSWKKLYDLARLMKLNAQFDVG